MSKKLHSAARISPVSRILCLVIFLLLGPSLASQNGPSVELDFDRVQADEAFRDGVLYLHGGRVNDAVVAFQRALSFKPDDVLARNWLGRAYYFGGYEEAAAEEWRQVQNAGGGSPALQSFMETLTARRGFGSEITVDREYFPTAIFRLGVPGSAGDIVQGEALDSTAATNVSQRPMPASLEHRPDGWFYAANFTQDAVQVYDANGRLRQSFTGGFPGFSGPFGLELLPGGRLAVSSFRDDRIHILDANNGNVLLSFGASGIGSGQFLGPQYIAYDPSGYLYINDYGNQRVQKWTVGGEFVLDFGGDTIFHRPTGLLFLNENVYVLDAEGSSGTIRWFDGSGNLLEEFMDPRLAGAESLYRDEQGRVLVFTRSGVFEFFPDNPGLQGVYVAPSEEQRGFVDGLSDRNGNLMVSDAVNREILVLSRLSGLYSGLHVQINRVMSDQFPSVRLDVTVEDRAGNAVLGIDGINFRISEASRPVQEFSVVRRGYQIDALSAQVVLAPTESLANAEFRAGTTEVLRSLWATLPPSDEIGVVVAGGNPQVLRTSRGTPSDAAELVRGLANDRAWALDLGIRLAANNLIGKDALRTIFLVGDGSISQTSFMQFGLEEVRAYLRNNGIQLNYIHVGFREIDPVYEYIVEASGGQILHFFDVPDFSAAVDQIKTAYPGRYLLEFESVFDGDFGRKYLPVEVEVSYLSRSGRDESGYFSPLSF